MKLTTLVPNLFRQAVLAAATLALAISAQAGLQIPYTSDPYTMHLWHLDDSSNQIYAVDAVATDPNASTNAIPITLTNIGAPTPGLPLTRIAASVTFPFFPH